MMELDRWRHAHTHSGRGPFAVQREKLPKHLEKQPVTPVEIRTLRQNQRPLAHLQVLIQVFGALVLIKSVNEWTCLRAAFAEES